MQENQTDCGAIDAKPGASTLEAKATAGPDRKSSRPDCRKFDLRDIAIFLDIDGTLLDLAPTPLDVRVPEQLHNALATLKTGVHGAIAFVSGRPIGEIDRLFAPLKMPAVGGHGAEIRFEPESAITRSRAAALSDELRSEFTSIVSLDSGILIEDKGYSVAIHYRQSPQLGGEVMEHIVAICRNEQCAGLEILPGKFVVEIKPSGYSKGTGLRELMAVPPFRGRKPIFIGDDVTDDAAFAELPNYGGVGFSVGGAMPGAAFNFDGPRDVRAWLERLGRNSAGHPGSNPETT
jgi:trehalose 6-phosphate phosphatase